MAKASGCTDRVVVIAYAGKTADIWWQGVKGKVERLQNVTVWSLDDGVAQALGKLAERTMRLQLAMQDGEASLGSETADPVDIRWTVLKPRGALIGKGLRFGRPFDLDHVAFRIEQIERRAEAFRAVTPCLFADARAVTAQMRPQYYRDRTIRRARTDDPYCVPPRLRRFPDGRFSRRLPADRSGSGRRASG